MTHQVSGRGILGRLAEGGAEVEEYLVGPSGYGFLEIGRRE